jgi:hypothetical protein
MSSMFKRLIIWKIYHHLPQIDHIQITYGYATNVTNNIPCKTQQLYRVFIVLISKCSCELILNLVFSYYKFVQIIRHI